MVSHINSGSTITIENISEPTLLQYFEALNAADFAATAALFATEGELNPPFENPIISPDAIASYLEAEAQGLVLNPQTGETLCRDDGGLEAQITGKVSTSLFTVNVAWQFILNPQKEITYARIKLLASPQELLSLREKRENGGSNQ